MQIIPVSKSSAHLFFQQQLGILDHVPGVPQVILAKVFSGSAGPSSQKYESFMYDIYFGGLLLNNGM